MRSALNCFERVCRADRWSVSNSRRSLQFRKLASRAYGTIPNEMIPLAPMPPDPNGSHSAGEKSGSLDGGARMSRLRSLLVSRWVLLLAGALAGGVVAAFFVANPHLLPNVESGSAVAASPYRGVVVVLGGWEYTSPELLPSLRAGRRAYGAPVRVRGYCIGAPTRNSLTKLIDERWLVLADSHFIPASYVRTTLLYASTRPLPCSPLAGVGGPASISLTAARVGKEIELHAVSPRASVVAFAMFDRGAHTWRPAALELESAHGFSVRVPAGRALVSMAVACWASRLPAHQSSSPEPLHALQPLADTPEPADEAAAARVSAGAIAACSPSAYGVVPRPARQRASKRAGSVGTTTSGSATESGPVSGGSIPASPVETYVPHPPATTSVQSSEPPHSGGKSSSSSSGSGDESESSTSVPPLSR